MTGGFAVLAFEIKKQKHVNHEIWLRNIQTLIVDFQ